MGTTKSKDPLARGSSRHRDRTSLVILRDLRSRPCGGPHPSTARPATGSWTFPPWVDKDTTLVNPRRRGQRITFALDATMGMWLST